MVFLILLLRDVHTAGFLMLPSNSIQDCHLGRVLSKLLLFLVFSFKWSAYIGRVLKPVSRGRQTLRAHIHLGQHRLLSRDMSLDLEVRHPHKNHLHHRNQSGNTSVQERGRGKEREKKRGEKRRAEGEGKKSSQCSLSYSLQKM